MPGILRALLLSWMLLSFMPNGFARERPIAGYPSVAEVNARLREIEKLNPESTEVLKLGSSQEEREILVLRFAKQKLRKNRPSLLVNATHHGDEKSSTVASLELAAYLAEKLDTDDALLDRYDIYVQPLVNPDGYASHRRENASGYDLNRDYDSPAGRRFRSKETQLVRKMLDFVALRGAVALHSGSSEILWPWGYTAKAPQLADSMSGIAEDAGAELGIRNLKQSYFSYPTSGEFIDYVYWKQKTLAFTMELGAIKTPKPANLPAISEKAIQAILAIFRGVQRYDEMQEENDLPYRRAANS